MVMVLSVLQTAYDFDLYNSSLDQFYKSLNLESSPKIFTTHLFSTPEPPVTPITIGFFFPTYQHYQYT